MPTLIKGIISPVTDPLLTLTAAGANDQPAECSHALCPIVFPSGVTVVASQSFPADSSLRPRSTPINANQFNRFPLSHSSSSSVTCFLRHNREWCRSVCGRGSGTQLTGVPALGTGTGPPRPGEQPEGQLALQCCFVQPYLLSTNLNVLLLSGTEAITAPTHPALPVASSRNKSLGFMEFIEFKEVYGVFLDGLWRPRQRANCGVVAGANRTPHVPLTPLLVENGQIVEVWYIGCHPRSRTILTFSTQTPFQLLRIHNAEPLIVNAASP